MTKDESMNRELKTRPVYECRCDERLKTKTEESNLKLKLRNLKLRLVQVLNQLKQGPCKKLVRRN
jgi:hypothetical protein